MQYPIYPRSYAVMLNGEHSIHFKTPEEAYEFIECSQDDGTYEVSDRIWVAACYEHDAVKDDPALLLDIIDAVF